MGKPLFLEYEHRMKQHKSPQMLERLRKRIVYDWETEVCDRTISVSEALMVAIHYDHIEMVDYLLAKNAVEATKISRWSRSHLVCAVDKNNTKAVEKLLQHTMTSKGNYDEYLANELNKVKDAGSHGSGSSVHSWTGNSRIRRYADQKGRCLKYGTSKSAIHVACKLGNVQCLYLLLRYGADPSINDHLGFSALEYSLTKLCHGKNIRSITDPIFECVDALLLALPHFHLSHYILPNLLQFAEAIDGKKEAEDDSTGDLDEMRRKDQAAALKDKLKEAVKDAICQMKNVRMLQHLCRDSIRKHVVHSKLCPEIYGDLPVPKLLKSYIKTVTVT